MVPLHLIHCGKEVIMKEKQKEARASLRKLKDDLDKLKQQKEELRSTLVKLETYISSIESKIDVYEKVTEMSFQDIETDILKDR